MARLAIIADDFTGACDAAAPLAAQARVRVVLGPPAEWPADTDVLAVDLDARELLDDEARARARSAALALRRIDPHMRVVLKIDSTLRGPIAALIEGVLEGSGLAHAVVCPAFPEQGRTVVAGRLHVAGEPRETRLADVLGPLVARCTVEDASTGHELRRLAVAWAATPDTLLVGSGGLTRQLALTPPQASAQHGTRPNAPDLGLTLDSSAGDEPHNTLASKPFPNAAAPDDRSIREPLSSPAAGFAAGAEDSHESLASERLPNAAGLEDSSLRQQADVRAGQIVIAAGSPTEVTRAQLERLPSTFPRLTVIRTAPSATRDRGAAAAAVAQQVVELPRPAALIVVGGQTGRLVCEALGAHGIVLNGEIAPGMPSGRIDGGAWHNLQVVTKAGGFGGPDALLDVLAALGVSCPHRP